VWGKLMPYIIMKTFIPYIVYLSLFTAYTFNYSLYYVNEESEDSVQLTSLIIRILLVIISLYFVIREINGGMFNNLGEYFTETWNYFDLLPPVLITLEIVSTSLNGFPEEDNITTYHEIQATILLFMWFKLMYFLRIFPSIGFYVKAIFEILNSIKYFLLVLLFTFAAFGECGRRLNHINDEDTKWMLYDNIIGSIL
jgi:uncharacterized membrane protein